MRVFYSATYERWRCSLQLHVTLSCLPLLVRLAATDFGVGVGSTAFEIFISIF